jgi:hypothetical protein
LTRRIPFHIPNAREWPKKIPRERAKIHIARGFRLLTVQSNSFLMNGSGPSRLNAAVRDL